MTNAKGYRRGTRDMFSRAYKRKGVEHLSTYLTTYRMGDIVDIKVRRIQGTVVYNRGQWVMVCAKWNKNNCLAVKSEFPHYRLNASQQTHLHYLLLEVRGRNLKETVPCTNPYLCFTLLLKQGLMKYGE